MYKIKILMLSLSVTIALFLFFYPLAEFFQKESNPSFFTQEETQLISQNLGHLLVDTLHEYAPYYDLDTVLETVRRIEKKEETLISPDKCQQALFDFKCKMIEEETQQNLRAAEKFLTVLAQQEGVVEVQKDKLYYMIIQKGEGSTIEKNSTPVFHFTETNLSNRIIRDTREQNQPIQIKLSETIAGFQLGVSGMRVGERRKIYVHSNLAYRKLSRQQLSIFDVEIVGN